MPRQLETDRWLFCATVALCLVGAVMVFSASAVTAREQYGNGYHFLLRQLLWLALGLAGMMLVMNWTTASCASRSSSSPALFAVLVMLVGRFLSR